MKNLKLFLGLFIVFSLLEGTLATASSHAAVFQFVPPYKTLIKLRHRNYYTWGIKWSLNPGEQIVSAQLAINGINNTSKDLDDILFIELLDEVDWDKNGVKRYKDNIAGNFNNFSTWPTDHELLTTYSDVLDKASPPENFNYSLNNAQLQKLSLYSGDSIFGLGFDSDCEYTLNSGISFQIITSSVPEPSTFFLLLLPLSFIAISRRQG